MLRNMSLKGKLLSICLTLAAFSVVMGTVGIFALRGVVEKYSKVSEVNLPNTASLGEMFAQFRAARISAIKLGTRGLTEEAATKAIVKLQEATEKYDAADKAYNSIPFMPGEDKLYEAVNENWKQYQTLTGKIVTAYKDPAQRDQVYTWIQNDEETLGGDFRNRIRKLIDFHRAAAAKSTEEAKSITQWCTTFMIGLVLAALGLSSLIAILFSNSLGKILGELAERLSRGAEEVASASGQVSSASESLSSSASEQAAALQQTASSVEELSATITKNSENALESRATSEKSQGVAARGKDAMDEMAQAISGIQQSTEDMAKQIEASNQQIAEITQVIGEIGNKTKVINDIVFQTKLLSFNASVEAARAGEHGKGFAVVAEEVGNLAAMSGDSARDISAMLESSIQKVQGIVNESRTKIESLVLRSAEKVSQGTEIAKRCGDVLVEIVENTSSVNGRITQISDASKEQENGVREISKAMDQLNQVTHQNASASQQAASASSELSAQAEALRSSVLDLERLIGGAGSVEQQVSRPSPTLSPTLSPSNVVHLRAPSASPHQEPHRTPVKKAAVGDIPSGSDHRFSDC